MSDLPLGKPTDYPSRYAPSVLRPVARLRAREKIGIRDALPFLGEDLWNCYELSWLDSGGLPRIGVLQLRIRCDTPALVESKSLKRYLGSFAQTVFAGRDAVAAVVEADLSRLLGSAVAAVVLAPGDIDSPVDDLPGVCLDDLPVKITRYQYDPGLLAAGRETGADAVHSHLFRSVCPVTGQPDWGSIAIAWRGRLIRRETLLAYLVSYRQTADFHEDAVERIFVDVKAAAAATELTVYGRFLRRGGIDINPYRSTAGRTAPAVRLPRQ